MVAHFTYTVRLNVDTAKQAEDIAAALHSSQPGMGRDCLRYWDVLKGEYSIWAEPVMTEAQLQLRRAQSDK